LVSQRSAATTASASTTASRGATSARETWERQAPDWRKYIFRCGDGLLGPFGFFCQELRTYN
jgi:hypothetical protein